MVDLVAICCLLGVEPRNDLAIYQTATPEDTAATQLKGQLADQVHDVASETDDADPECRRAKLANGKEKEHDACD